MTLKQCTSRILMVRPSVAAANPETRDTNAFQGEEREGDLDRLHEEFDQMVKTLRAKAVDVTVYDDPSGGRCPDAMFPNNWVSFHLPEVAAIYPMMAENRRQERQLGWLGNRRLIDLTSYEAEGMFLEGTGSMVFDRVNLVAYAALSPRTHPHPLENACAALGFFPMAFEADDEHERPIYHTNVVLAIGEEFAVLCSEAITSANRVISELKIARKEVIEISRAQMARYCGNVLQLRSITGESLIVMSQTAYAAFEPHQLDRLKHYGELVAIEVPTVERLGGGSVRCMIAEVF